MRANSQFAIAVHALTLLALSDRPLSSAVVAGSAGTNPAFVRRIIGDLQRAGLVETRRGLRGGVALARAAAQITLLDAYQATQHRRLLSLHHSQPLQTCLCGGNIEAVLVPIFAEAEQALHDRLTRQTIAQVADAIRRRADAAAAG
jgi:Rrf2 family protein